MTGAPTYLVDTSVLVRMSLRPVELAIASLDHEARFAIAPPVLLEFGFTPRSLTAWESIQSEVAGLLQLALSKRTGEIALGLQHDLWAAGKVRAAGAFDTLIAAVALENDACVLHYDRDYEHLASVCPELRTQWVVSPGSIS